MALLLLLVAVPIIEIALFIQLGGWLGLWPTLAIVLGTAVAGSTLLRVQGLATLERLQRAIDAGESPAGPLAHGALILIAGVLLLTPGFFTDAVGLALMLPPVRALVIRHLFHRLAGRVTMVRFGGSAPHGGPGPDSATVEGDYEVVEPDPAPGPRAGGPGRLH